MKYLLLFVLFLISCSDNHAHRLYITADESMRDFEIFIDGKKIGYFITPCDEKLEAFAMLEKKCEEQTLGVIGFSLNDEIYNKLSLIVPDRSRFIQLINAKENFEFELHLDESTESYLNFALADGKVIQSN